MAIAYDSSSGSFLGSGATSLTFSHTCSTGSDRLLLVFPIVSNATDIITGVTYAGAAMSKAVTYNPVANYWGYCYYKYAPATGANNVVISVSSSVIIYGLSWSGTGCLQSGFYDGNNNAYKSASGTITTTITTTADNCWNVCATNANSGQTITAGTGATQRYATRYNYTKIFDSNGAKTPAGSYSMNTSFDYAGFQMQVSVAPVAASGPANVKTWNGLAKASVKTVNGLAIASVKSINGLT